MFHSGLLASPEIEFVGNSTETVSRLATMVRPPLALGHHGSIKVDRDDGQRVARCRFRDLDGVTRRVARWGTSKAGAQAALQDELRQRTGQRTEVLKPNSRFREACDIWMGKIHERRADSTADTYASCLPTGVVGGGSSLAEVGKPPPTAAAFGETDTGSSSRHFGRCLRPDTTQGRPSLDTIG